MKETTLYRKKLHYKKTVYKDSIVLYNVNILNKERSDVIMSNIIIGYIISFIGFYFFTKSAFSLTRYGAAVISVVLSSTALLLILHLIK